MALIRKVILVLSFFCSVVLAYGATQSFQGKILDSDMKPIAEAEVYLYDSANTRRPADFISPRTGQDGKFLLKLPEGKYWAIARLRHGDRFGPLLSGDLHSGNPVEIEINAVPQEMNFTIRDIRESSIVVDKDRHSLVKLKGRITDQDGKTAYGFSVYAWREPFSARLPDAVSNWTENNGEYFLSLLPGSYFLLATDNFPPKIPAERSVNLVIKEGEKKVAFDMKVTKMDSDEGKGHSHPDGGLSVHEE